MIILDGKAASKEVKDILKMQIAMSRKTPPRLAIVQVGDNAASNIYVKNKMKACAYVGVQYELYRYEKTTTEELISVIRELNYDSRIHGIFVQLPLPKEIDTERVLSQISVLKDVDGFHSFHMGNLVKGNAGLKPCTPQGIITLLKKNNIEIEGKHCVVVGRSNIVGKPLAAMLLNNNGTVTVCHSHTENLKAICKQADILVCAIGSPKFFNSEYVKEGAVVIDVGINRIDNKICGDVDFEDVKDKVYAITPVPGGVGPMTVAMLIKNCLIAAEM